MKRLSIVLAAMFTGLGLTAAEPNILDVDKYLAGRTPDENNLVWLDAADGAPIKLAGFYWEKIPGKQYNRLPWEPARQLPEAVVWLGKHTAGGQMRFRTNASRVLIRAATSGYGLMPHMPQTGSSGFDLYVGDGGRYSFVNSSAHPIGTNEFTKELFNRGDGGMHDFIINFPLYDGVEKVELGFPADSKFEEPPPFAKAAPIVIYGTSMTQGGCASRPGNLFTNILSRKLNREFLNYGFSGSGRGEPELAELLSEIEDPALFILNYEGNDDGHMAETLPAFLDILRSHHPDMPIMILTRNRFSEEAVYATNTLADPRDPYSAQRWRLQYDECLKRRAAGDEHIYFCDGGANLGDNYADCMVDGWHPNDLGFWKIAQTLEPVIAEILEKENR